MATESIIQFVIFWAGVVFIAYLCYGLAGFVGRLLNLFNDEPDGDQTYTDANGVKWFKFDVHYVDQSGSTMSFYLWAMSFADAQRRLKLIAKTGFVDSQIYCQIKG